MAFNLEEYFCPVPGTENEKDIVIFARRHWVSFMGQIIMSFFLLVIPIVIFILAKIYAPNVFSGNFLNFIVLFGSVYYLVVATFIYGAWISYYYDIYIVTRELVVDISQDGFFHRNIAQLSILRVQDVSSNIKGILPTMFAYGDVLIETAGESAETFLLKAVPNPQQFSAKVLEIHNQIIDEESRHGQIGEAEGDLKPMPVKQSAIVTQEVSTSPIANIIQPPEGGYCPPKENKEGEMSKDDLNQGGEIKL